MNRHTLDLSSASAAVQRAGDRVCELLAGASDPTMRLKGSDWTVRDVAVHLAVMSEVYTGYAHGETEPFVDVSDIAGGSLARSSAARLEAEAERDLAALAGRLRAGTASLLDACRDRDAGDTVVWNGRTVTVGTLLGIALAELLVHGLDVARTLSRPWPIAAGDARLVLDAVLPLLPLLVDKRATGDIDVRYDLRVRGGARVMLHFHDGVLDVAPAGGKVDCHVRADPAALLLVSYGRRSQWVPALTGRLVAWGRRPWLGLRLTRYLVAP